MKYIEYKEQRSHGTKDFPFAYYFENETHPRYNMIYHWHTEFEIIYVKSGEFSLSCEGEGFSLQEGDCGFISGGMLHGGVPKACIYECLVFDIEPLLNGSKVCSAQLLPVFEHHKKIQILHKKGSFLTKRCEKIIKLMREKEIGYDFCVQGEILCLFGELIHNGCVYDAHPMKSHNIKKLRMFKSTLSFIEKHYNEQLCLDDLSAQCSMNSNYFCRAFKELTGKTPIEYLNYYRIESACEQIAATHSSLLEIALSCGFNDYSYFIKVFKKFKGVTPHKFSVSIV